jgi:hypothetical protein
LKTPADGEAGSSAAIRLSAGHGRALSSHFKTVEEYLRVVASRRDGFDGIFYRASPELHEEQRTRARGLIGEVLGGLEGVRGEQGLERQQMSSIGVMRAYLSELWVTRVETRGRYRRGWRSSSSTCGIPGPPRGRARSACERDSPPPRHHGKTPQRRSGHEFSFQPFRNAVKVHCWRGDANAGDRWLLMSCTNAG